MTPICTTYLILATTDNSAHTNSVERISLGRGGVVGWNMRGQRGNEIIAFSCVGDRQLTSVQRKLCQ